MLYDAPDFAPPFGIPRPAVLPPDDAVTDAQCALVAAVEHAYLDIQLAAPALPRQAAIPDRAGTPRSGRTPLDDAPPTPATSTPGPHPACGSGKNATDRRYPPPGRQQG